MLTTPYATPELEVGDAKWLAAMIDGEGFISLNCHERTRKGNTTAYFFPIVGVSNSHDGLLARVRELVGTRFTAMRHRAATEKHKSVGTTTIARIAMADVLTQIRPYLIAKQRQADIVIEFCGIHDRLPVRTAPLERFETMFVEMKRLNKRGA